MSCFLHAMTFIIIYSLFATRMLNGGPLSKNQNLPAVPVKLTVTETLQLFLISVQLFLISVQQIHTIRTLAIGQGL